MTTLLKESAERWEVDLRGRTVELLTVDHRVTLHLHGAADYDGSIILEAPFRLATVGRDAITVDPEEKASLAPVLECFGKDVSDVWVLRTEGTLFVTFTDGTTIESASCPQYEAWELNASGVKIVAMPGGGEPALFA